MRKQKIYKP